MKGINRILPLLAVLLALVSHGAGASLIGDQVTCTFAASGFISVGGTCSSDYNYYTPAPATVSNNFEFWPGYALTPEIFITGASVNVGADFIQLFPSSIVIGYPGSFFLNIFSLNWVGEPARVITGVLATATNLDPSKLNVTFTDHSVHIAIVDDVMQQGSGVKVQLFSGLPVPAPSPLLLASLGLGLLLLQRQMLRRASDSKLAMRRATTIASI